VAEVGTPADTGQAGALPKNQEESKWEKSIAIRLAIAHFPALVWFGA
jgi:hypothetical protein